MDILARILKYSKRDGECLVWTGCIVYGYGQIRIGSKSVYVHRVVYELVHGPIPSGLFVCHYCDVRNCIEADHLALGTMEENNMDKAKKGRTARMNGETNGNSKLTNLDIAFIRHSAATNSELAYKYNVSIVAIRNIRSRATWAHVK